MNDTKLSTELRLRRELDEVTRDRDEWEERFRLADEEAKRLSDEVDRLRVPLVIWTGAAAETVIAMSEVADILTSHTSSPKTDRRRHLDNVELVLAAECIEFYADSAEEEGDVDGAEAARDTAATMRHIAELSYLEGRPRPRGRLQIPHPTINVEVVATYELKLSEGTNGR